MSLDEQKAQERELGKIAGEFTADDITTPPAVIPLPNPMSMQLAGYVIAGVTVVSGVMAAKRGAHWHLQESEIKDLHLAVARVCEKYISIDLNSPLMGLVAVVAAIAVPRVMIEMANNQNSQPVAEQGTQGGD